MTDHTEQGERVWTVWPCDHGGVRVEEYPVPPHHQCAKCGAKAIRVIPEQHHRETLERLAGEFRDKAATTVQGTAWQAWSDAARAVRAELQGGE